jgi:hypothetical protein
MAKGNVRTGNPAEQAVPWGAVPQFSEQGQAQVSEQRPDATEPFTNPGAPNLPIVANAPEWKPEPQQSPFDPSVKTKSVFAPKVKPVVKEEAKVFPVTENDPDWVTLVKFVQKHGEHIIQARYPHPRGECIDTIYRGVTVFAHETTQVRHVTQGWIDWKDAIYE